MLLESMPPDRLVLAAGGNEDQGFDRPFSVLLGTALRDPAPAMARVLDVTPDVRVELASRWPSRGAWTEVVEWPEPNGRRIRVVLLRDDLPRHAVATAAEVRQALRRVLRDLEESPGHGHLCPENVRTREGGIATLVDGGLVLLRDASWLASATDIAPELRAAADLPARLRALETADVWGAANLVLRWLQIDPTHSLREALGSHGLALAMADLLISCLAVDPAQRPTMARLHTAVETEWLGARDFPHCDLRREGAAMASAELAPGRVAEFHIRINARRLWEALVSDRENPVLPLDGRVVQLALEGRDLDARADISVQHRPSLRLDAGAELLLTADDMAELPVERVAGPRDAKLERGSTVRLEGGNVADLQLVSGFDASGQPRDVLQWSLKTDSDAAFFEAPPQSGTSVTLLFHLVWAGGRGTEQDLSGSVPVFRRPRFFTPGLVPAPERRGSIGKLNLEIVPREGVTDVVLTNKGERIREVKLESLGAVGLKQLDPPLRMSHVVLRPEEGGGIALRINWPGEMRETAGRISYELSFSFEWRTRTLHRENRLLELPIGVKGKEDLATVLAVDHGATNCCIMAGVAGSDEAPRFFPVPADGKARAVPEMPTRVWYSPSSDQKLPLFDERAHEAHRLGKDNCFASPKPFVGMLCQRAPFLITHTLSNGLKDDVVMAAWEVVRDYYCSVIDRLAERGQLHGLPRQVVLTHPVRLGLRARAEWLRIRNGVQEYLDQRRAAQGLDPAPPIALLDEASAAGIFCARTRPWNAPEPHYRLLVVDVGGSTTDLAVLDIRTEGPSVEIAVIGEDGLSNLGGNHATAVLQLALHQRLVPAEEAAAFPFIDLLNAVGAQGSSVRPPAGIHVLPLSQRAKDDDPDAVAWRNGQQLHRVAEVAKKACFAGTPPTFLSDGRIAINDRVLPPLADEWSGAQSSFQLTPRVGGPGAPRRRGRAELGAALNGLPYVEELEVLRADIENAFTRVRSLAAAGGGAEVPAYLVLTGHSARLPLFAAAAAAAFPEHSRSGRIHLLDPRHAKSCVAQGAFYYGESIEQHRQSGDIFGDPPAVVVTGRPDVLSYPIGRRTGAGHTLSFAPLLPADRRLLPVAWKPGDVLPENSAHWTATGTFQGSFPELFELRRPGDMTSLDPLSPELKASHVKGRKCQITLWVNEAWEVNLSVHAADGAAPADGPTHWKLESHDGWVAVS